MKEIFERIWSETSIDITKQENPKGYVLGGQPGAGKSRLISIIQNSNKRNMFIINADEFRKYHPQYLEFQKQNDKTAQDKTADFIAKASEYLLEKAMHCRFNLVIEGTFRTATTPIKTLQKLKENGYETYAYILLTSKNISWNSCIERYEKAITFKRYTSKDHHDLVVSQISKNINEVLQSKQADKLKIFVRDFENELLDFFSDDKDIYDFNLINEILYCTNQNELNRAIRKQNKILNFAPKLKTDEFDNSNTHKFKL